MNKSPGGSAGHATRASLPSHLSSQTTTFYEAEKNIVPIAKQLYEASVGLAEELWKEFTKELVPVG